MSPSTHRKLLDGLGLAVTRTSEFDSQTKVVVPVALKHGARALDLANRLVEAEDVVDHAAPNFLAEFRKTTVNDPLFKQQWHLHNTGQNGGRANEDVRAAGAWALGGGGDPHIVIAIIDDGVDLKHPDLASNIWRNPDRSAKDRHGRDFVDDRDPWNPEPKVFNPPYNDTNTNDIHGTPCAGVAAAVGNNRKGVAGIAHACRILPVKVFAANFAPNNRLADGIRYAGLKADVLSCSWSAAPHPDIESAIRDATERGRHGHGTPVFVATGNEYASQIAFPSNHARAFAVGASNDRGRRSVYSNYGKGLAFVGPSSDDERGRQGITTTDVRGRSYGYALKSAYCDNFGGTSSAAPLAAGIAALVLSANARLTWDEVGDILKETADKIDPKHGAYREGCSAQYGYGRLNAEAAVARAQQSARRRRRSAARTAKRRRR